MKNRLLMTLSLIVGLTLLVPSGVPATGPALARGLDEGGGAARQVPLADSAATLEAYGQLPLSFIANEGQWDDAVRFQVRGPGHALFFTPAEVVFALQASSDSRYEASEQQKAVVRLHFIGANPAPQIEGLDPLPGIANFFSGSSAANWRTNVPTYQGVRYQGLYPGIDLSYHGLQGQLKSEFVVAAGAEPEQIRLRYEGVARLGVDGAGRLVLATEVGELVEEAPVAYQEVAGQRVPVVARYQVWEDGTVGFALGPYDRRRSLVIDPTLIYSTYLGGSGWDRSWGIAVDSTGSAYVTGWTKSADFPTENPHSGTYGGGLYDTFVTKLNATGNALVYSTYLGGSGDERSYDIVVDDAGCAYITGGTKSTNFPIANPLQPTSRGGWDAFVTKLGESGSVLVYSTYLGGTSDDFGQGIAVDGDGSAYVTGQAVSSNFPVVNPFQSTKRGGLDDGFVTKLNAAGTALVYSTYLGGSGRDYGIDIAVDGVGNAYVTGPTHSTDFPTKDAYQGAKGGGLGDAFVTKLDPTGSDLVYSTYLGGNGDDGGGGIAVDGDGNAYVAGTAGSSTFPTTVGAFDVSFNGGPDVFVAKFSATGGDLVYSTFLGGSGTDFGSRIAVNAMGMAYVTGTTFSDNFSTANPWQDSLSGVCDAYVTKLNATGSALVYSTYLGGSGGEEPRGIAVDGFGNAYVGGTTGSSDYPLAHPYQDILRGEMDAVVTKIADNQPPTVDAGGPYSGDEGSAIPLDGATASDPDEDDLTYAWSVDDPAACSFDDASVLNPNLTCSDDGTYQVTLRVNDGQSDPVSDSASVEVNNVAPTFEVGDNEMLDPCVVGAFSRTGITFTDPGDDVWSGTVNWGDSPTEEPLTIDQAAKSFDLSHTYAADGDYLVTVVLEDDDGGSDTDTFWVHVAIDSDCDGVLDIDDVCWGTLIPESVPTVELKPNRWALVDNDFEFDTIEKGKGNGPGRSYTTTDTAGCSCEQIIEAQGLGQGHTKHGCSISAMDEWVALVNP